MPDPWHSVPLYLPGQGWRVELMDPAGNVLATVPPSPAQAAWLAAHPVEALDMRATWELINSYRDAWVHTPGLHRGRPNKYSVK